MPNIKNIPKPIEIIQVVQRLPIIQALFMDEVVGMSVVMKGKDVRSRHARRREGCHRSRILMRLPVFMMVQNQVPTVPVCQTKDAGDSARGPVHCKGTRILRL